jgi:propanediol utilization protein
MNQYIMLAHLLSKGVMLSRNDGAEIGILTPIKCCDDVGLWGIMMLSFSSHIERCYFVV